MTKAVKVYKKAVEAIKDQDVKNFIKVLEDRYYAFITFKGEKISCINEVVDFCDNRKKSNINFEITILFYIDLNNETIEKRIITNINDNVHEGRDNSNFLSKEEIKKADETVDSNQEEVTQEFLRILTLKLKKQKESIVT